MKTLLIVCCLLLTACASNPNNIDPKYVPVSKYTALSCDEIHTRMDSLLTLSENLHSDMKRKHATDIAATTGSLFFWPVLFFIKGKSSANNSEYARLQGMYDAMESAADQKHC
jgi:hypothetical protein